MIQRCRHAFSYLRFLTDVHFSILIILFVRRSVYGYNSYIVRSPTEARQTLQQNRQLFIRTKSRMFATTTLHVRVIYSTTSVCCHSVGDCLLSLQLQRHRQIQPIHVLMISDSVPNGYS